MKSRAHDPTRLDVATLANENQALNGTWPGVDLTRLALSQTVPQDSPPAPVDWRAQAERVPVAGGEPELWLRTAANTRIWLTCQRCMQPFSMELAAEQAVRFVRDEATAEALDAEVEEDVLALPRWLNLRDLIEDELLLSLPLVPRHGICPQPLIPGVDNMEVGLIDADASAEMLEAESPFAALRALKTDGGSSG